MLDYIAKIKEHTAFLFREKKIGWRLRHAFILLN